MCVYTIYNRYNENGVCKCYEEENFSIVSAGNDTDNPADEYD